MPCGLDMLRAGRYIVGMVARCSERMEREAEGMMDTETRNTLVNMLGEMHGLSGALWLARELSLLFLGAESTVAAVAILCDSKERWHAMLCQMHDGRWYPAGVDAEEMMHLCMMACMPAAVVLGLDPRDVHEALQQGLTEHTTRVPFAVEFSPEVEM